MKTVAIENAVYAKLLKLKSTLSHMRGRPVTFSELLEENVRRPLTFLLIDGSLMMVLKHLIKQISQNHDVHGIILFGSVAKGTYHAYSDVDLFILTEKADSQTFDYIEKSIRTTEIEYFDRLTSSKLPVHFAPFISSLEEIDFVLPIFFDIADGGMILYDPNFVASDFIDKYASIPHSRKYIEGAEVLTW